MAGRGDEGDVAYADIPYENTSQRGYGKGTFDKQTVDYGLNMTSAVGEYQNALNGMEDVDVNDSFDDEEETDEESDVMFSLGDDVAEESAEELSEEEKELRDGINDWLRGTGFTVETSEDVGQRVLDEARDVEEQRGMDAVKRKVLNTFHSVTTDSAPGQRIPIGTLTTEGRQFLERLSGQPMKERVDFIINPSELRHIYNEHYGRNEKDTGNNIPLNDADIRALVDVITQPDHIVFGVEKKDGRKIFYFLKDSGNGTYNLAEVYSDKKGNLTAKTFYKTKKGSYPRAVELINSPTLSTPSTSGASPSSGANLDKNWGFISQSR